MKNRHHQVKSKWYYIFWGVCTVSVVLGQLYVGTGYRVMAQSITNFFDTLTEISRSSNDIEI